MIWATPTSTTASPERVYTWSSVSPAVWVGSLICWTQSKLPSVLSTSETAIGKEERTFPWPTNARRGAKSCNGKHISEELFFFWNNLADHLPQYLFRFLRKALQQLLPTASNLFRWKIATSPTCTLCMNKPQSNAHVLSNCSAPKALERYTLRHNAILSILACWITSTKSKDQQLFADLPLSTCSQIADIFLTCVRPDLVLVDEKIHVLELTVCHENNLAKSRQYKQNKYSNISDHLDSKFVNYEVELFTIEVSVLGFISDISDFCADAKLSQMPDYIKTEISKSAINNSYNIYRLRNRNDWSCRTMWVRQNFLFRCRHYCGLRYEPMHEFNVSRLFI